MKTHPVRTLFFLLALGQAFHLPAHSGDALLDNADLEKDLKGDGPDDWPTVKAPSAYLEEEGNHFVRLVSSHPGETVMWYREIPIPSGVEALELSWKQRVTGLQRGSQSWFDARIMMDFMDADRNKVSPGPSPQATGRDTDGWQERSCQFLVPEGATMLKFMPCLFQVKSGTFDLDDIQLNPINPAPVREARAARVAERQAKQEQDIEKRRAKAARLLASEGNLIPNGTFEKARGDDQVEHWGSMNKLGSWELEDGNRYMRLKSTEPGKLYMVYRTYDLPGDVQALELSWRQRVRDLQRGEKPWFDARIMMDFLDAAGNKLKPQPGPAYTQRDTDGWVSKSKSFLVPPEAVTLVLMPSLFQVKAGSYDLDDFKLVPADVAPLHAAAEKREAEIAARYVPDEEPKPENWPPMLKVVGNRLHDPEGNEVWLQGLNAGGLETLPQDEQPVKSLVVGIEEWKANLIRVPIKDSFWYGQSDYQKDDGQAFREKLDKMVTLAANRGAYVLIDLHRYRAPKQEHADFWKDCAAHFKDHPAVLFDLINEPHDISWEIWKNGGWVGNKVGVDESAFLGDAEKKKNQGFESIGMQAMVDAVRSTGAKNIVVAGGLFWCNDLTGIVKGYALEDATGNGIMYSWHTYNWHGGWAKVLPTAAEHPILVGEFGADIKKMGFIPENDQEDPYTWVPDMLGFIQKHRLNYTAWCFHPRATPVLIEDWSYTPTDFYGKFVKKALDGKTFEMKRMR